MSTDQPKGLEGKQRVSSQNRDGLSEHCSQAQGKPGQELPLRGAAAPHPGSEQLPDRGDPFLASSSGGWEGGGSGGSRGVPSEHRKAGGGPRVTRQVSRVEAFRRAGNMGRRAGGWARTLDFCPLLRGPISL